MVSLIFLGINLFSLSITFFSSQLKTVFSSQLWDLCILRRFSLVPWTHGKFILILIFSLWISVACVNCCDWGKLWLLDFANKIMLSWYPYSFNTCFTLAFSLCKSSLFVIMEYALSNKEEKHFPCSLFGGESCSVGIDQYV